MFESSISYRNRTDFDSNVTFVLLHNMHSVHKLSLFINVITSFRFNKENVTSDNKISNGKWNNILLTTFTFMTMIL